LLVLQAEDQKRRFVARTNAGVEQLELFLRLDREKNSLLDVAAKHRDRGGAPSLAARRSQADASS
jgi:hypothetical protein